jgi:hypothetical protein
MINKIFNFFTGSKTGGLADSLADYTLKGTLYKKVIGRKKEEISEEAYLFLTIVNEKTWDYNLNIANADYEYKKGKL